MPVNCPSSDACPRVFGSSRFTPRGPPVRFNAIILFLSTDHASLCAWLLCISQKSKRLRDQSTFTSDAIFAETLIFWHLVAVQSAQLHSCTKFASKCCQIWGCILAALLDIVKHEISPEEWTIKYFWPISALAEYRSHLPLQNYVASCVRLMLYSWLDGPAWWWG